MEGEDDPPPLGSVCPPLETVPEEDSEDASTGLRPSTILYELLVLCEWRLEPRLESLERSPAPSLRQWVSGLWTPAVPPLPEAAAELAAAQPAWHLDLSPDGLLLAILQEEAVEVRSARDNFTSIAACREWAADPRPQWRRLRWSTTPTPAASVGSDGPPSPLLAVAASSGAVDILDASLSAVCVLYPEEYGRSPGAPVAELVWAPPRCRPWQATLLVLRHRGDVTAYHVSAMEGYQEVFRFTFKLYPHGVSCAAYDAQRRLLVLAGRSGQVGSERLQGLASCDGVTCWRLTGGPPHLQLCQGSQEGASPSAWLPWRRGRACWDPVTALSLCPGSRRLLSAHRSGALTVWQFPSLRKQAHWPLEAQPGQEAVSPRLLRLPTARRQRRLRALDSGAARPAALSWWSEAAAILARRNGAVTVSDADSLQNLLGESAEFFSGAPRLSAGPGPACLVLECERSTQPARRRADSGGTSEEEDPEEEEEEEPAPGLPRRLLDGVRWGLHWLTDSERFEPPRRRARLSHTLYRLTCLRSTTPRQLYARKIELAEYGEALMLAEAYNLDSDLVFLRQWQQSAVTADSVRQYLARVRRRSLVLAECVSRVPADPAAARLLLEHGLRGTGPGAVVAAADPARSEFLPGDGLRGTGPEALLAAADPACSEFLPGDGRCLQELTGPLTGAQRQLLQYRRRLLGYRRRLSTYLRLVGEEHYEPAQYSRFRDRTALEAALEFAHRSDWEALQVMLRYHGDELMPHRLLLLCHIPETTEPALYSPLLPELDSRGAAVQPEMEPWEEPDWVDGLTLDGHSSPKHSPTAVECPPFAAAGRDLTAAQVGAWYCGRARQLVALTGLVGHGLELVQLGRERNVPGLEPLRDHLDTLSTLVYDAGRLEVTLESFSRMSPERVVELMMTGATESSFVSQLRRRLLPYLGRREQVQPGSSAALLHSYVLRLARQDLSLPALLVLHSAPPEPRPLVPDPGQLAALALDAVYACPRPECGPAARRMVAALEPPLPEQRRRRDLLAARLAAAELLAGRGEPLSAAQLAALAGDRAAVTALLQRLCRTQLREPDCGPLLDDMLEMQQKVFQVVTPQTCQEIYVLSLLSSGRPAYIEQAAGLMCTAASEEPAVTNVYLRRLPHPAAQRLAVTAAREYFDGSASLADPGIRLARQCLQLIGEPGDEVCRELDLVDSLEYLVQFGVSLLPVQVRLTPDKLTLLQRCLDSRPDAYRRTAELVRLGRLLRLPDDWRLLALTAERALAAGDPAAAARAARHLASGRHTAAWQICRQVAQCDQYRHLDDRLSLLSFCLLHCPAAELESLLRLRQRLLSLRLQRLLEGREAGQQSDRPDGAEREWGDQQARQGSPAEQTAPGDAVGRGPESQEAPSGPRSPGDGEASPGPEERSASDDVDFISPAALLKSTRGLTGHIVRATASTIQGTTEAVLRATSDTTKAVLQATAGGRGALVAGQLVTAGSATASLLRSTVSRLTPGQRPELSRAAESANAALLRPGVPAFLADTVPGCHESAMDTDYRSFSAPAPPPALELAVAAARLEALEGAVEARRLTQLLPPLLAEDTALALGWALSLPDAALRDCCELWPSSELSLRAAAYCVALRVAARRNQPDLLTASPGELVSAGLQRPGPDADSAAVTELRRLLQQLCDRRQEARQAAQLLRLDRGVDVARFAAEPDYQRDTILGLCMSDDDAALELAAGLAARYGVSAAQLARTHLLYLFSAAELTAAEVQRRLTGRALAERALREPGALAAALREAVLPSLAGTDHDRLLCCLSLLCRAEPAAAAELSARVTLLRLLRGSGVDFWRLLQADAEELAALLPRAVSAENVDSLEDLAPRLGSPALTSSAVAAAWLVCRVERAADWRPALDAELGRLGTLAPPDWERCAARLVFGDAALSRTVAARRQMVTYLAQLTSRREPQPAWDAVREKMQGWDEHLENLEWGSYTELLESTDDDVYRFARQFDQTRGEAGRLGALRTRMVADGCGPAALRRLLAVFPLDQVAPLQDVLLAALRETAAALRGRPDLRPLAAVLAQLRRYIDEDGEGLTTDQVVTEFRRLCDDPEVEAGRRLKAARLLTKHFPADRALFPALVQADTAAALPDTPLSAADTESAGGRAALLARLTAEAGSVERLAGLAGLLRRWPQFPAELAADPAASPLCRLCARALELEPGEAGRGLVLAAAAEHAGTPALPPPALGRLVELLRRSGAEEAALQTALLSADGQLRREAIRRAEQALLAEQCPGPAPWPLSDSVLDSLLSAGALPQLVGTALYGPAVARLLAGPGDAVPAAVSRLRQAGCQAEAAALLLRARADRPETGQGTIGAARRAASQVLSKWLQ